MEEVIELIENGQRKSALKMLVSKGYDLEDLFIELNSVGMCKEMLTMLKIAQSTSYISYNPANLREIK